MAKDFKIQATLTADDQATAKVKKASGAFGGLSDSIKGLAVAAAGAIAIKQLTDGLIASVAAANRQEQAVQGVRTALAAIGETTPQAVQGFEDFAASLQRVTTVGDETILQMSQLALSFTSNAEQAKALTAAALDFSRGAGISFEESIRRIGRSMSGSIEDISKFAPEINNLTKEQLANGDAIAILQQRYAGFAASEAQTFGGALTQLQNNLGDLSEKIGSAITENEFFNETLQSVNATISSPEFQQGFETIVNAVSGLAQGVVEATQALIAFLAPVGNLIKAIGDITGVTEALNVAFDFYVEKGKASKTATEELGAAAEGATPNVKAAGDAVSDLADKAGDVPGAIDKVTNALKTLGLTTEAQLKEQIQQAVDAVVTLGKEMQEGGKVTEDDFAKAQEAAAKKITELTGASQKQAESLVQARLAQEGFKTVSDQLVVSLRAAGDAHVELSDKSGLVTKTTGEVLDALDNLGTVSKNTGVSMAELHQMIEDGNITLRGQKEAVDNTKDAFEDQIEALIKAAEREEQLRKRAEALNRILKQQETQANATTRALNNLAAAQGRAGGSAGLGTAGGS